MKFLCLIVAYIICGSSLSFADLNSSENVKSKANETQTAIMAPQGMLYQICVNKCVDEDKVHPTFCKQRCAGLLANNEDKSIMKACNVTNGHPATDCVKKKIGERLEFYKKQQSAEASPQTVN